MKRVVLFAVVLLALGASGANGATFRVHLSAVPRWQTWESPQRFDEQTAVGVKVYSRGWELEQRIFPNECGADYAGLGIFLTTRVCGNMPIRVAYRGLRARNITLIYWT